MKKAILSSVKLNDEKNSTATQYMGCVGDIFKSDKLKKLDNFEQHNHTSRLQHSINVSYYSFLWSRKLGLDYRSAARAGLVHDMYFYDWRRPNALRGYHPLWHALVACDNSKKEFGLNEVEQDAVKKHMWPCIINFPKYKESYIVSFADKFCAVLEFADGINAVKKVIKFKAAFEMKK